MANAKSHHAMVAVICAALLSACSTPWRDAQQAQAGEYILHIRTDPSPLQVGRSALIVLRIERAGQETSGCRASFRQLMPGMEMDSDRVIITMEEGRKGDYQGRSTVFRMGGDWRIEISFRCDGEDHIVPFDYTLAWPE